MRSSTSGVRILVNSGDMFRAYASSTRGKNLPPLCRACMVDEKPSPLILGITLRDENPHNGVGSRQLWATPFPEKVR